MTKKELIELLKKMKKNSSAVADIYEEKGNKTEAKFYRGEASSLQTVIYMLEDKGFAIEQAKIYKDYE